MVLIGRRAGVICLTRDAQVNVNGVLAVKQLCVAKSAAGLLCNADRLALCCNPPCLVECCIVSDVCRRKFRWSPRSRIQQSNSWSFDAQETWLHQRLGRTDRRVGLHVVIAG